MSFSNQNIKFNTLLLARGFNYQNIHMVPSLIEKATVSYAVKKGDINHVRKITEMLELITKFRPALLRAKKSSVSLKIRKGAPLGAKVTLQKSQLNDFLTEFVWEILPNISNYKPILIKLNLNGKTLPYMFKIEDSMLFSCLKNHYYIFNTFSEIKILFSFKKKNTNQENYFLAKLLKLPVALNLKK